MEKKVLTRDAIRAMIGESVKKLIVETPEHYDSDPTDLIEFAKEYVKLGWSVQEQFDIIMNGANQSDDVMNAMWSEGHVNPNAVDVMSRHLRGHNAGIDDALDLYERWYNSEPPTDENSSWRDPEKDF